MINLCNGVAPHWLWLLWSLVMYEACIWKLQVSGSLIFLRVTLCRLRFCEFTYIFDSLDSAKYCFTVVAQLCWKVTFWNPRTQRYLLLLAVLPHSNWISFRRPEMSLKHQICAVLLTAFSVNSSKEGVREDVDKWYKSQYSPGEVW